MKSVLIITGPREKFGSGHEVRMHTLALELKSRQITVQHLITPPDAQIDVPLEYTLVLLDRRDSAFNPGLRINSLKIAIDNRGAGRDAADVVLDLLPHFAMNKADYSLSLAHIILRRGITESEGRAAGSNITLHNSGDEASAVADFYPSAERLSPAEFSLRLRQSRKPALYFGQALFEAIYLGLDVQLYPVSDYHQRLSVDLFSRRLIEPALLNAVDGLGVKRVADKIVGLLKQQK